MKQKVIVGLSGGVDSSVSALLLLQQGYEVEGLFMNNWADDDEYCHATEDAADAQSVCDKLGIKLHTISFAEEYWDHVFEIFLKEYRAGRTPNPDILCNKEIKFKAFLDYALNLGADFIATGHYVRKQKVNNEYQLLKGLDHNKDQSYFLYTLKQQQLKHCLFPVGELQKPEVRQLAEEAQFLNHQKKDSTGICFIGERKFKDFLQQYLPAKPGNIEDEQGSIVGKHDGLMYYTIGQRKGIGVGGQKAATEAPWYVLDKDLNRNVLLIGQGDNNPKLYAKQLICHDLDWVSDQQKRLYPFRCSAKIRYRQLDQFCQLEPHEDGLLVTFDQPQRAIALGQSIVFYNNSQCLGGGIITEVNKTKE